MQTRFLGDDGGACAKKLGDTKCRYVAPEYANTGLLNERSDVYSFGVLLMEIITGRDPVDYNRAAGEVGFKPQKPS